MIAVPPPFVTPESFCLSTIISALKLEKRIANNLGIHKWWLLRDYSAGKNSPEVYAFFIEIGIDRPALSVNNTAIICWSPKPFSWGFWERLLRRFKKSDYPRKGDTLQTITVPPFDPFTVKHMIPQAHTAQYLRALWNSMINSGWVLEAQNEVVSSRGTVFNT